MVVKVENDCVVRIAYRISDVDGHLMEERTPDHAYEYLHGRAQIVGPVERALEGKTPGFQAEISITPRDGYGEYDPALVTEVSRDLLPTDIEIAVGMKFSTQTASGVSLTVRVIEIEDDIVTLDGNHPLAGLELIFDVKVLSVRAATELEKSNGRPNERGAIGQSGEAPIDDDSGFDSGGVIH